MWIYTQCLIFAANRSKIFIAVDRDICKKTKILVDPLITTKSPMRPYPHIKRWSGTGRAHGDSRKWSVPVETSMDRAGYTFLHIRGVYDLLLREDTAQQTMIAAQFSVNGTNWWYQLLHVFRREQVESNHDCKYAFVVVIPIDVQMYRGVIWFRKYFRLLIWLFIWICSDTINIKLTLPSVIVR